MTDDGEKLFIWDAENRLIEIKLKSDNSTVATYAYDYQSRRITKTVGSTVTNFVYDGWNPIAEYTSALSPLSFTLSTSYTWGMDLSGSMQGAGGVGGLLSVNDGSDTYFPTFDGNGNVSEYVDATGNVVANYEYDAFGRVVASGTKANDFTHQFSTKQLDSESGLHYYGYRYYDSSNGRWLGRDPVMELGGENLYGVAINDTLNQIDYLGLSPLGPVVIPNRKGSNCAGTAVLPRHVLNNGGQAQYVPSPQNMTNPSGEENEDKTPGAGCRKVSGSSDCKTKKPDCERHVIVYIPLLDAWGARIRSKLSCDRSRRMRWILSSSNGG